MQSLLALDFSQACHSSKVCSDMQVMGPDKAYLVQHTDNTRIFWADKHELVLGACFKGKTGAVPRELLDGVQQKLLMPVQSLQVTSFIEMLVDCIHHSKLCKSLQACQAHNNTQYRHVGPTDQHVCFVQDRFGKLVDQGYQATLTWHQGKSCGPLACMWSSSDTVIYVHQRLVSLCLGSLESDDSSAAGELPPTVKSIKWAYSTRPVYGWGNSGADQKSTAGWLAALPVFEPHWQVHCLCVAAAVPP